MKFVNLKLLGAIVCISTAISSYSQNNWTINGNGNTTGAANFLGTTNNEPLNIRTNDIQRMFVFSGVGVNSGFIGVGNNFNNPLQRFHVVGDINLETNIFQKTAFNDGFRINNQTVLSIKNNNNLFLGWNAGASWANNGNARNTFICNNSGSQIGTGRNNSYLGFDK